MPRRSSRLQVLMVAAGLLGSACVQDAPELDGDPFADEVVAFSPADDSVFGHEDLPEVVLGPPTGLADVASLGCGGEIVLRFNEPGIVDGPGVDLIVFENPFTADFPEPGEVAVSEDGQQWFEFPCVPEALDGCAGVTPTLAYPSSKIDPTDPELAGGDGFDLATLDAGLTTVYFVRIRDRSSEYWATQDQGPFCDPGQQGAGGFDLDAVAAVHAGE